MNIQLRLVRNWLADSDSFTAVKRCRYGNVLRCDCATSTSNVRDHRNSCHAGQIRRQSMTSLGHVLSVRSPTISGCSAVPCVTAAAVGVAVSHVTDCLAIGHEVISYSIRL